MKLIKRISCMVLLLIMLTNSVFAQSELTTIKQNLIEDELNNFFNDTNFETEKTPIKLYDVNDKFIALYYSLKENGYVIIDAECHIVLQFSKVNKILQYENSNGKCYYNGYLNYWSEEDGKILTSNSVYDLSKSNFFDKIIKGNQVKAYRTQDYHDIIPGTVPNYSYNPNGICGSVAAAMYLAYMDTKNDNYVATENETSDGIKLIQHLVPFIDGSVPGSTSGELYGGMINYLDTRGINDNLVLENSNDGVFPVSAVVNDKPYVLGLIDPKHWVTGYGYAIQNGVYFALVNDRHGNTREYINFIQTDFVVY